MASLRVGAVLLLAAGLVAACDAAGPSSVATDIGSTPTRAVAATASARPSAATSGASARPSATAAASAGESARPSVTPAPSATRAPAATIQTPAPATSVSACTGSSSNQQFLASTSSSVAWDLYCAVLPSGWFVDAGSYTSASGGTMVIGYRTNAGSRLDLKEGAWCVGTASDCGPYDTVIGAASFGDLGGQLGKRSGAFVLYVRPGQNPAWAATGTGIDEATFRSFLQALVKVAK